MLLHTDQLTKNYGRQRALDRLTLDIGPGEIFGLLGPNGSGKSTALRLLLGFLRPTSGRASIAGHDCWWDSVAARREVAYLPGELRLYENLTARQLVDFLTRLRGQTGSPELESLAARLDIDLNLPLVYMSSGMKRKVALLQVLAARASLLILDEPTNTLDPTMREQLLGELRQARQRGQSVLLSSHVLGEVEQVCDRVGILQSGRLVHVQKMAELKESRRVCARFVGPLPALPDLPGMIPHPRQDSRLDVDYNGPLPPLLDWLARQPVDDLRIEPLGLGAIYRRYHGAQA